MHDREQVLPAIVGNPNQQDARVATRRVFPDVGKVQILGYEKSLFG
jgi:hypothetical protein